MIDGLQVPFKKKQNLRATAARSSSTYLNSKGILLPTIDGTNSLSRLIYICHPGMCHKSQKGKLVHSNHVNFVKLPNSPPNTLLPYSAVHFKLILYLVLATALSDIYKAQCLSLINKSYPLDCGLDKESKHEPIQPMVVIGNKQESKNETSVVDIESTSSIPLSSSSSCPNILKIHFSGFGDKFVIDLVKNKRLISDRYFKISKDIVNRHGRHPDASTRDSPTTDLNDGEFYKNHLFINLHSFTSNEDHCHYHGYVNDNLSSISAISIVNHRLLTGFFHDGNDIYYLHANASTSTTLLSKSPYSCLPRQNEFNELPISINLSHLESDPSNPKHHTITMTPRSRREIKSRRSSNPENYIKHEPFQSNVNSLFVELLVVHDHSQYLEYKGNTSLIAERTMQIVNIMNAFYRQLNIFVALVGVVLWTEKDEIQLTDDGDATLTNFLKYRFEKLLPKYHHDNAQLITSTSFNGSVVGKALKGPICTHEHSGGVNTDHSHSPAIVAVTLAHELGHNFGMEHDEDDKCKCPDEKCIMSSSSSTVHPKHWSSCSIEHLEDARKHGLLDCLANRPDKVFGPICGNGFVEENEDCDLGEQMPSYGTSKSRKTSKCPRGQDCDQTQAANPCCDRHTCKFVANATCAQGPCCDLSTCSVFNSTTPKICRSRQSECDLEEVCDGQNEYCPPDVHYHDGIECGPTTISNSDKALIVSSADYNRSRAYCYKGKCANHDSQCQLLWGPSGSVSKEICYEQNVHGNTSGNCGYNRRDKAYESCEPEDAICGMLHCVHNQPNVGDSRKTGKLGYGFESASILTVSFFVMSNHAKIFCHGAVIDAGPNMKDPGLVPDGASCGENKMCLNQRCIPTYDVLNKNWCPSDCNGNGVCDNIGVCHCYDGTIGTSCYQFFGPNFHLSLLLYTIMFFVPVIALIVFTIHHYRQQIKIWWFLHNRKIALKSRKPTQHRRLAYDANRNNLTISEPIPLSQHNNTSRPFYQPVLDPWAEICESGKGSGYRLEPIEKSNPPLGNTKFHQNITGNDLKPGKYIP